MLTVIVAVMLIWVAWKVIAIGFRVAFGVAKILLPVFLVIGLLYIGLVYFAIPIILLGAAFLVYHFVKA